MNIVSLDFWGTIAVFNPEYAKERTRFLADLFGMTEHDAHERYKTVKHGLDYRAEKFGVAYSPLSCVQRLIEGQTLRIRTNAVEVLDRIEHLVREHPPIIKDEMFEALAEARRQGMILGISSNTNFIRGSLLLDIYPRLELDFSVHSDELGVSKPDPDFFRTVLQRARKAAGEPYYPAGQLCHIGDNEACDVRGSQRAGMRGFLTTSPAQTITILSQLRDIYSPRRISALG